MKGFFSFSIVLWIISAILLLVGLEYSICSFVSALIALFVAIIEIIKSKKLEKKLNSYDDALQTKYDDKGNIKGMTYDCGTY